MQAHPIDSHSIRCLACRLPMILCLCSLAPQLQLRSRLTIIMHRKELFHRTATVPLVKLAIQKPLQVILRGQQGARSELNELDLDPDCQNIVLFPHQDSVLLSKDTLDLSRPVHMIVPDGNWNQAKKTIKRIVSLRSLPKFRLPPGLPSQYHLRTSPHVEGVCTYEAICRALGIIEGQSVQVAMEEFFLIAMKNARKLTLSEHYRRPSRLTNI